jgi:hypothetical protein
VSISIRNVSAAMPGASPRSSSRISSDWSVPRVRATLEIEAEIEAGTPKQVVCTVTEKTQTPKFTAHGFEQE